jgi:hypothetical protein
MDVIPFFGTSFNFYFPVLIVVFAIFSLFNLFGRLLRLLGIKRFEFSESFQDDAIADGKLAIRKFVDAKNIQHDGMLL